MEEKIAYIFGDYLIEFVMDNHQISGEVFYPGEKMPVGKISCHFYNYNNPEDKSHRKDDSLHIDILRVQVDHDKKGIGTFLMKKLIESYVDKYKIKHITTTPSPTARISMEALKRFYLKFRFGSGFLSKKIEFVDEDDLLADVFEQTIESGTKSKNIVSEGIGVLVSDKNESAPSNSSQQEKLSKTTKANRVGYQTVIHFLDEALKSKNDIVQLGASGADVYGLYLARKGHNVVVVEPNEEDADALRAKVKDVPRMEIVKGAYGILEEYESESKDAVLCFEPLSANISFEDKQEILRESYRVCKRGGTVFALFLTNEMMVLENTFNGDYDYLSGPKFDSVTLKAVNTNYRIMTFDEIEVLFKLCHIKYSKRFAAEGVSMLIRDKMEGMTEKQFNRWMDYHYKTCTRPELLGCSNHVVYVIKKP